MNTIRFLIAFITMVFLTGTTASFCAETSSASERFFANYKNSVHFDGAVMSFNLEVIKKEEASGKTGARELKSETSGKIYIGGDHYRVEFSGGAIDGTITIVRGTEAWVYYPETKRVKNYKSKVRRQGILGGALTMEDFLIIGDLRKYYKVTKTGDSFVEMKGAVEWLTYELVRITFDAEKHVPKRMDFGRTGEETMKTLTFGNFMEFGSKVAPSYITARLPLKNVTSKWTITSIVEKKNFSPDLFDPEKLGDKDTVKAK